MRREFLQQNKIRYDENINIGEDFIFYLDCLRQGAKFYLLSEAYYCYRTRILSLSYRKPLDFLGQSCEIITRFINRKVRSKKDRLLLQALLVNLKVFQQRIEYYRVVESIKEKQLWLAVKLLIDLPYVMVDLGRQFLLRVQNKLKSVLRIGVEQNGYRQAPNHNRVAYFER